MDYHKQGLKYTLKAEEDLPKLAKSVDSKLLQKILDLISELNSKGGKLEPSYSYLAKLQKLIKQIERDLVKKMGSKVIAAIDHLHGLNSKYFQSVTGKNHKVSIAKYIGVTKSGIKSGGLLGQLFSLDTLFYELKSLFLQGITTGMKVLALKKVVSKFVRGGIVRRLKFILPTVIGQAGRISQAKLAQKHKLKHFIYTNSLISTSRKFCIKRAGKVFTIEDSEKWINDHDLPLSPKWKLTYQPLVHMGGFNCRHFPKFITEQTALQLGYKN